MSTESLILDLIEWVEVRDRTYQDTLEAWRTSCPRLPVWEDAIERGLVTTVIVNRSCLVRASAQGMTLLREHRPSAHARIVGQVTRESAA